MNSSDSPKFRFAALSVVKHDYVPRGVMSHPHFELAVVADSEANPAFIASDLLSQVEHGPDSQVLLPLLNGDLAKIRREGGGGAGAHQNVRVRAD